MSAWIETEKYIITNKINYSRTLMSAWIETAHTLTIQDLKRVALS